MAEAGPSGVLQSRFEDGMRFLGLALALETDQRSPAAAVSAACDAIRCFLEILAVAAEKHLPDPDGSIPRLRRQCEALLDPRQTVGEAPQRAVQAALLARDAASRLLPALVLGDQNPTPPMA